MLKRIGIWVLAVGLSFALFTGCALVQLSKVAPYKEMYPDYEYKVTRVKEMGGEAKAPYETAKAETYLKFFHKEVFVDRDAVGAELMRKKLDQYIEQAMMKVQ